MKSGRTLIEGRRTRSIETKSMQMTLADGNVFADLGFTPEEAVKLKANSQRLISLKRDLQDHLVTELAAWIGANDLMQANAAQILGITRQRVSYVINKKGAEFSIDSLVNMLARAGKRVTMSVT